VGEITTHHARSLAEATIPLDDDAAAAVEEAVLARAPEQRLAEFRRSLTRVVLKAAPKPAEERHLEAVAQRRVVRSPDAEGNGMWWIAMLLPDAGATVVMTAIHALAKRVTSADPRTADQRRADAVIQLALDALHGSSSGELPREHRMRPAIQVSVALSTLLGLDEQPGDLAGSGPIPERDLGAGWSPTRSAGGSTTAARSTGHPKTWPITSSPATGPAGSGIVSARRAAATWTTRHPGTATAKPTRPTSTPCAADTTTANTTPAGHRNDSTTAPSNGHHPPDTPTSNHPPPTPSITRRTRQ
jgi:hypothetical protein